MEQIGNIVVPTDFSPLAEAAVARAVTLARLDGAGVHLVHSMSPLIANPYGVALPPFFWKELCQTAARRLEELRRAAEARGAPVVSTQVLESADVLDAIASAAKAHRAELIVMGTHGRGGIQRAFLGNVCERALRTLDRPILAVKEDPETAAAPIAKILLAVDFSPHSDRAVEATAALAERLSASVDVIHAFHAPADYGSFAAALEQRIEASVRGKLDAIRAQLHERRIRTAFHFRRGRPDVVIADMARQIGCQLIAMGTRGKSGLSHVLLGSVADRTLRAAPCSVLCVKAEAAE